MNCFRKVRVLFRTADTAAIIDRIRLFCTRSQQFTLLETESASYSHHIGSPGCVVMAAGCGAENACIALCEARAATLEVTNIFPAEAGHIGMKEANEIAMQFAAALATFSKHTRNKLRVEVGTDQLDASAFFRDRRLLTMFNRLLVANPKSTHPSDILRIDLFTCGLFRYYRGTFYAERLVSLLMQDYKWSEDDARRCSTRIDIGLDVLKVSRKC